jgi:VIT1/CCC1 family predicted Fe2+/Mn2+ transporter
MIRYFEMGGLGRREAEGVATRLVENLTVQASATLGNEIGLTEGEGWSPLTAGLLTGVSFLLASLVPVLPFIFLEVVPAAITSTIASVLTMFLVGASKAIFTRSSWLRSGFEVMAIGTLATAATYLIGLVSPF